MHNTTIVLVTIAAAALGSWAADSREIDLRRRYDRLMSNPPALGVRPVSDRFALNSAERGHQQQQRRRLWSTTVAPRPATKQSGTNVALIKRLLANADAKWDDLPPNVQRRLQRYRSVIESAAENERKSSANHSRRDSSLELFKSSARSSEWRRPESSRENSNSKGIFANKSTDTNIRRSESAEAAARRRLASINAPTNALYEHNRFSNSGRPRSFPRITAVTQSSSTTRPPTSSTHRVSLVPPRRHTTGGGSLPVPVHRPHVPRIVPQVPSGWPSDSNSDNQHNLQLFRQQQQRSGSSQPVVPQTASAPPIIPDFSLLAQVQTAAPPLPPRSPFDRLGASASQLTGLLKSPVTRQFASLLNGQTPLGGLLGRPLSPQSASRSAGPAPATWTSDTASGNNQFKRTSFGSDSSFGLLPSGNQQQPPTPTSFGPSSPTNFGPSSPTNFGPSSPTNFGPSSPTSFGPTANFSPNTGFSGGNQFGSGATPFGSGAAFGPQRPPFPVPNNNIDSGLSVGGVFEGVPPPPGFENVGPAFRPQPQPPPPVSSGAIVPDGTFNFENSFPTHDKRSALGNEPTFGTAAEFPEPPPDFGSALGFSGPTTPDFSSGLGFGSSSSIGSHEPLPFSSGQNTGPGNSEQHGFGSGLIQQTATAAPPRQAANALFPVTGFAASPEFAPPGTFSNMTLAELLALAQQAQQAQQQLRQSSAANTQPQQPPFPSFPSAGGNRNQQQAPPPSAAPQFVSPLPGPGVFNNNVNGLGGFRSGRSQAAVPLRQPTPLAPNWNPPAQSFDGGIARPFGYGGPPPKPPGLDNAFNNVINKFAVSSGEIDPTLVDILDVALGNGGKLDSQIRLVDRFIGFDNVANIQEFLTATGLQQPIYKTVADLRTELLRNKPGIAPFARRRRVQ